MPRKEPILNEGSTAVGSFILLVVILAAVVAAVYFGGPPTPIKCESTEISMFAKDGKQYCVPARKP